MKPPHRENQPPAPVIERVGEDGVVYVETLNADSLMHRIMGDDWCGYSDFTHRSPWITADWLLETAA